jgi:dCTP deaminase
VAFTLAPDANGILPDRMIAAMADAGLILPAYPFVESQIQPASLDLRLGDTAYRVRASFLPGPGATVAERIDELKLHEIDLSDGAVLETNCVYIVPLLESLALPPEIVAAANPKSSTGRLDVFTRVIADGTRRFDMIGAGYHGPLYAEISPKTFPVLLREGSRLSQVRFRTGDAILSVDELDALHELERLVDVDDADLVNGVALSVDLSGENASGFVGYRAKRHTGVVDIDRRGGYAVDDFWEPIAARPDGSLILDPGEFYILASKEAVQVPPDYAAEMVPFDPLVGEFRVHYAGFFDPGFGYARGAGSAFARGAVHSGARPDRRPPGLRKNAGAPRRAVRPAHRLQLPGAGVEAEQAFSGVIRVPGAVRHSSCRSAEPGPRFKCSSPGPRLCSAPLRKCCALRCVRGTLTSPTPTSPTA